MPTESATAEGTTTTTTTTEATAAPAERPESPAEKLLRVSKWYFRIGFFGLPWLWGCNALMLYQYRNREHLPKDIVWYRNMSALLFTICAVIFAMYIILARTALEDVIPWVIKPGVALRQDGLFSKASLVDEIK